MVQTCFLCKWRSDKYPRRSYHRFPLNNELKQKWLEVIGENNLTIGTNTFLCSLHFEEDCFHYGMTMGRKVLKEGSLPTLHLTRYNLEIEEQSIEFNDIENVHEIPVEIEGTSVQCEDEKTNHILHEEREVLRLRKRLAMRNKEIISLKRSMSNLRKLIREMNLQFVEMKKGTCEKDDKLLNVEHDAITKTDFNHICRTCLNKSTLTQLFINSNKHYVQDIRLITGVKIKHKDGLPQSICSNCIISLENAVQFKERCKLAEEHLLVINQTQSAPNEEEVKNQFIKEIDVEIKIEPTDAQVILYNDNSEVTMKSADPTAAPDQATNRPGEAVGMKEVPLESNRKRVLCTICHKNLSVRSVDSHMDKCHPGVDDRKVECDLCKTLVMKEKYTRHRLLMHGPGLNVCANCKMVFDSQHALVEHASACSVRKKKPRISERELKECEICHKVMQKASLRKHIAFNHSFLGPVCEHCGHRFANKLRLTEHCRAKHGYEKIRCSSCDFRSSSLVSMKNHERRHHGEKPYVCEQCGANFHAAYLLAQHRQSHRTERPFKCDQCPARFKANNSLHMHKSACHSVVRYGCGFCPRIYSSRHYATRHLRSVHSKTPQGAHLVPLQLPPILCGGAACD